MKKITLPIIALGVAIGFSAYCINNNKNMYQCSAIGEYTIEVDDTYLKSAVVSSIPMEIDYRVVKSNKNYDYNQKAVFSVVEGNDVISIVEETKFVVNKPGEFVIKAALEQDESQYTLVSGVAYELKFGEIRILSPLENITVYTQPIPLKGKCDVDCDDLDWWPEDVHDDVKFEIEEGPAYITVGDYMHITGVGTIELKCSSIYNDEVYTKKTINVTDPDEGKEKVEKDTLSKEDIKEIVEKKSRIDLIRAPLGIIAAIAIFVVSLTKRF